MRAVAIVIVIFGFLSFDLVSNNGEWVGSVQAFMGDVLQEIRHILSV
jgi:hypothetical protein